jgi:rhodanese-related sulfurtransferase
VEDDESDHVDIEGVDDADNTAAYGLHTLRLNAKRSASIPLFGTASSLAYDFSSLPPSPMLIPVDEADDVEILGPDSVTVQELDQERLWQAEKASPHRSPKAVKTISYEG